MTIAPRLDELVVRRMEPDDAPAMRDYALRNRAFLAPWEPLRGDDAYELATIAARLEDVGDRIQFGAWRTGELVGQVALANFARAPVYANCTIGYSVDERSQGMGVATAMVAHAVLEAFEVEGLHRVEAGTLVHNVASQRVLEKCGFTRIGIAPRLVRIAGRWQDHVLFAITAEDRGRLRAR